MGSDNDADAELDAAVEETRKLFQPFISKPKMTKKLLAKPPVRFIRDVFMEVCLVTGFGQGLFDEEELNACTKTRGGKFLFIESLLHLVGIAVGDTNFVDKVRVSQVAAGLEPVKTNRGFFQNFHKAATDASCRGRWAFAVAAVKTAQASLPLADSDERRRSSLRRLHFVVPAELGDVGGQEPGTVVSFGSVVGNEVPLADMATAKKSSLQSADSWLQTRRPDLPIEVQSCCRDRLSRATKAALALRKELKPHCSASWSFSDVLRKICLLKTEQERYEDASMAMPICTTKVDLMTHRTSQIKLTQCQKQGRRRSSLTVRDGGNLTESNAQQGASSSGVAAASASSLMPREEQHVHYIVLRQDSMRSAKVQCSKRLLGV